MTNIAAPFAMDSGWVDKVIDADNVWAQIKAALDVAGKPLPETLRRPDVRIIVNNISGHVQTFQNPGNHSGQKPEEIPADGDKRAIMVMVKGDDLEAQHTNAAILAKRFDLAAKGLSDEFVAALQSGACNDLVAEAYGPAPYEGQASKLVEVKWPKQEGLSTLIEPVKSVAAAFGARAATAEKVFLAHFPIFVKGTGTVPELVESTGMCVAVSEDYNTKAETTRPIVPSVAKQFYGIFFEDIPTATINTEGYVQSIMIGDEIIEIEQPQAAQPLAAEQKPAIFVPKVTVRAFALA